MFSIDKNVIRTVMKVVIWAYVVPCAVLVYVSMNLKFDSEQTSIFFVLYLLLVTLLNISVAKKICTGEQDAEQYTVNRQPTVDSGIQLQKAPSIVTVDPPPPYSEVNEDPPPYGNLKYYWKMFRNAQNRSSTRSIEDIRHCSQDAENPNWTDIKNGAKEKVKRSPSSPN